MGLGPPNPECKAVWEPTGLPQGGTEREPPLLRKDFVGAAGHGGQGERCRGEIPEFSAFPFKTQTSFLLLDIFSPGHFPLFTCSLCQANNPFLKASQGAPAAGHRSPPHPTPPSRLPRRWAAPVAETRASWGCRAASLFPMSDPLTAALLFSLAWVTGCDACFLLLLQSWGRAPNGMVGSVVENLSSSGLAADH